jgi:MGT family glycosyltransferase
MGKAVALVYPTHGHIAPALGVVEELVRRGEEVTFYATPRARKAVEETGARFRAYGPDDQAFNPDPPTDGLFSDMARLLALTESMLPDLIAQVAAEAPDYLLFDTKSVWGRLVSQVLDLPAVTLSVVFAIRPEVVPVPDLIGMLYRGAPPGALLAGLQGLSAYADTARRLQSRHGVVSPDIVGFLGNPQPLTIVFTSQALQLQGDRFPEPEFAFVGTSIPQSRHAAEAAMTFPFERLSDDPRTPLVYVSLGTTFNDAPAFYRACFEGLADLPCQVVLSTGGAALDLPAAPANFIVSRFVPQLRLLKRSAAFITHGGMNSANESLALGVPMIVVPQRGDQHLVAARVTELGAGVAVSPREVNADRLRTAVDHVLTTPSFTERARGLADSLANAGGAVRAADLILSATRTGQSQQQHDGMATTCGGS